MLRTDGLHSIVPNKTIIVRSRRVKTHTVAGRIVDAESGSPMREVEFGYSSATKPYVSNVGSGYRTDLNGEFSIENVKPGRYMGFAVLDSNSDSYSDVVPFEMADDDVRELQIKVRRGSSISGVAVVEGLMIQRCCLSSSMSLCARFHWIIPTLWLAPKQP